MELHGWEQRYRSGKRPAEDLEGAPAPLLVETVRQIAPGRALDLACGAGRNALWLAERGWSVIAVDGAAAAIEILRRRARVRGVQVDARVADLEKSGYAIEPSAWDLVVMSYYLQRSLFEPAMRGVAPGGVLVAIVHLTEPGEEPTATRLEPGALAKYFSEWEILHSHEGAPHDPVPRRAVAEIVARRPSA